MAILGITPSLRESGNERPHGFPARVRHAMSGECEYMLRYSRQRTAFRRCAVAAQGDNFVAYSLVGVELGRIYVHNLVFGSIASAKAKTPTFLLGVFLFLFLFFVLASPSRLNTESAHSS